MNTSITAAMIAKYAPALFLVVHKDGVKLNWPQLVHTLLVSAIVAAATMFGTMKVVETKIEHMEKTIERLVNTLNDVALRQARVVSQADEIHKTLIERVHALELRR
jgi:hypothetical protein